MASHHAHKEEKKDGKNEKDGIKLAELALLIGVSCIAIGAANYENLATKLGVGFILFYVFTGGVFSVRN